MALAVHFGILENEVDVLKQQVQRITEGELIIYIDAKGKGSWDSHVPDFIHCYIVTKTPMSIINLFANYFNVFMHPSTDILEGENTKIIVTDELDHNEEYIELRFPV